MKNNVGKIKSISFDEENKDLEITIVITDSKFKKKLLRDLSLSGNISIEDGKLIYIENEEYNAEI